jgi:hypothetical protein
MNFILVLLPVSDVYISNSNDHDPRTQRGYEVNIMLLYLRSTDIPLFHPVLLPFNITNGSKLFFLLEYLNQLQHDLTVLHIMI